MNQTFLLSLLFCFAGMLPSPGQDYQLSFTGSGEKTSVDSVKVENLATGAEIIVPQGNVLSLLHVAVKLDEQFIDPGNTLETYSNFSLGTPAFTFLTYQPGEVMISLHDITDRVICHKRIYLTTGRHSFEIRGIINGWNVITVISGGHRESGKIAGYESCGRPELY